MSNEQIIELLAELYNLPDNKLVGPQLYVKYGDLVDTLQELKDKHDSIIH
jgi:hypothetical protein